MHCSFFFLITPKTLFFPSKAPSQETERRTPSMCQRPRRATIYLLPLKDSGGCHAASTLRKLKCFQHTVPREVPSFRRKHSNGRGTASRGRPFGVPQPIPATVLSNGHCFCNDGSRHVAGNRLSLKLQPAAISEETKFFGTPPQRNKK